VIVFRNTDIDTPFLWESSAQPPARWHGSGEGPAQYFSSTPEAAWAEFLRRQEIREAADLAGVERVLWTVEIDDNEPAIEPDLPRATLTGDTSRYRACQAEAARLRTAGATRIAAPSAAVDPASPSGWRVEAGLRPGKRRMETSIVLFGDRPNLTGWRACAPGAPGSEVLARVRYRK
jgi:hypothetical protein